MPLYEYRCTSCGREYEELVLSSAQVVSCPDCASSEAERLLSSFGMKRSGPIGSAGGSSSCASCSATSCSSCKGQ